MSGRERLADRLVPRHELSALPQALRIYVWGMWSQHTMSNAGCQCMRGDVSVCARNGVVKTSIHYLHVNTHCLYTQRDIYSQSCA